MTAPTGPQTITDLGWLITLRWAAIAGQLATIAGVAIVLDLEMPLIALGLIIAAEACSNAIARTWFRRAQSVPERVLFGVLTIDVLALTGLLYFTGGPHNPFNFLYLVYIALAAVVLSPASTWALAGLSAAAFGGLFFSSVPLGGLSGDDPHAHHAHHAPDAASAVDPMALHLQGMWVAFTVGAAFIVYFVTRVKRALADRDRALAEAREAAASAERLASLATLAAGAAHELATPLGTIAIAARELELELEAAGGEAVEDARLIRSQVKRCRTVLDQLAIDAGGARGDTHERFQLHALIADVIDSLPPGSPVEVTLPEALRSRELPGYRATLGQMLAGVIRNGLDATRGEGPVRVIVSESPGRLRLRVQDEGSGMDPATLARATEPFFTTKPTGRGMGLGLFLARTTLERLGGSLEITSEPGVGTSVDLLLPTS